MSKRHTTKHRRRRGSQVLEVRVLSPRIAWLGFLNFLAGTAKLTCLLAVLAGIGWGIWQGIQRAFYQNPDFSLQVLDLNENSAIDELGLARLAGINLVQRPSLFELDHDLIASQLAALPAIAEAHAERHLPGTLVVRVTARSPRAWIASPATDRSTVRQVGGLLVDSEGIVYPCPERQFDEASQLPVIFLPESPTFTIAPGKKAAHPELKVCFHLLDSAREADPASVSSIESLEQANPWSLRLTTRDGTVATFGLLDHARQMVRLRSALDHASRQGYSIATINLIPKQNVPITIRNEAPPRAIPVAEPTPLEIRNEGRQNDLNQILSRG
jgi:hypothetical protein